MLFFAGGCFAPLQNRHGSLPASQGYTPNPLRGLALLTFALTGSFDADQRMKLLARWMRYAQFFVLHRSAALRISASFLSCSALTANPPTAGKQTRGR